MKYVYIIVPILFFFIFNVQQAHARLEVSCFISPSDNIVPGETVRWTAETEGGKYVYQYNWSGSEGLSGNTNSVEHTYRTQGLKSASVTVTSGNESVTTNCSRIRVEHPPLRGACNVTTEASSSHVETTWGVDVVGGDGSYTYSWSGTDGLSGTTQSITHPYYQGGFKEASVMVRSNGETMQLSCNTTIPSVSRLDPQAHLFGCEVSARYFITGEAISWNGTYSMPPERRQDVSYVAVTWEGPWINEDDKKDEFRSRYRRMSVSYPEPGYWIGEFRTREQETGLDTYSRCQAYLADEDDVSDRRTLTTHIQSSPRRMYDRSRRGSADDSSHDTDSRYVRRELPESDPACFIATAAYGSPWVGEVEELREFRDTYMNTNPVGRLLVDSYYTVSPILASVIQKNDALKQYARTALFPIVSVVKLLN